MSPTTTESHRLPTPIGGLVKTVMGSSRNDTESVFGRVFGPRQSVYHTDQFGTVLNSVRAFIIENYRFTWVDMHITIAQGCHPINSVSRHATSPYQEILHRPMPDEAGAVPQPCCIRHECLP